MSTQAITYILGDRRKGVWLTPPHPSKGAARLVMISIANHASDDTWEAWPSIELIAAEANMSYDRAKVALRACVANGWLERDVNGAPDDRMRTDRRPNLWRILVLDGGSVPPPPTRERAGRNEPDGGSVSTRPRGVAFDPPNRQKEPSGTARRRAEPSPQDATAAAARAKMIENEERAKAEATERPTPEEAAAKIAAARAQLRTRPEPDAANALPLDDG